MSHFALLWKARTIEKYRQDYEKEKINSIIMSNADIPQKTLFQRWRHYSHHVQKRLSRKFSKWYPEGSTMSNFLVHFRAETRFPHILLRSLFGFVGGLVLTYLCFVFLVFQLSLSLVHATALSSIFGILITLGLTFSNRIRCLVFLLIPQLFSRAGRYTLTCYALVLILTGPATNTLNNSEVLSESMACSQERIKSDVEIINGSMKKPINSIKDSIKFIVEQGQRITAHLKSALLRTNRMILNIAALIQANFSWLGSMSDSCNSHLGRPYNRCVTLAKASIDDCSDCYNKHSLYYAAASVVQVTCGVLRPYNKFCVASDFTEETFYATVRKKLKTFVKRIGKIMFLKIHTHHSYTFIGNTSTPSQVAAGIVTEIRKRADPILTWLSWSSCVTSLFLLLIIFRAKHYQLMYLTRYRFDNRYITKEFRELDLKRMREGRKTVLPLNRRERLKYVTTTSFRLVASEKMYLNRSALFMMITTFKLLIHIVADYSLYWVLMTIRHHGTLQSPLQPQLPATGVQITGRGFISRLLQSLIDTLNIPLQLSTISSKSCLPNPKPPDFKRYGQIVTLITLLWFLALFEPYGLRLRHLIMGHYKPDRAKTRASWLYNHILRTRGSFMKFARRKLHREYKYVSESNLTFRRWLLSIIPIKWLQRILGIHFEEPSCLLCSAMEDSDNPHSHLFRCQALNCPGTYCSSCFSDIGQMCTICLSPTDYGDLSDVSLEKGSDDDDDAEHDSVARKDEYTIEIEDSQTDVSSKMLGNNNLDACLEYVDSDSDGSNDKAMDYEMYSLSQNCDKQTIKKSLTSFYGATILYMSFFVTTNEVTCKLAKIVRNRKLVRKNGKTTIITHHQLTNCENHRENKNLKVSKGDHKKNNASNPRKIPGKQSNDERNTNNVDKRIPICYKHSKPRLKKSHFCSKYWSSISKLLSCTSLRIPDTIHDFQPMEGKKHKRKKKHMKTNHSHPKNHESKQETREYRLNVFFADQYWRKISMNDKNQCERVTKINKINHRNNEIEVNNVQMPRLDLRFLAESIDALNSIQESSSNLNLREYSELDMTSEKKNDFELWTLRRFLKRMSSTILRTESLNRMKRTLSLKQSFSNHTGCDRIPWNKKAMPKEPIPINNINKANKEINDINKTKDDKMDKMSKNSLNDLKIKRSTVKRQASEKFLGYNAFKSPVSIIKELYASIFTASCSTFQTVGAKKIKAKELKKADKEVTVHPIMKSCECQQSKPYFNGKDRCIQVEQRYSKHKQSFPDKQVRDVEVNAVHPTCTCATQYYIARNNINILQTQDSHVTCEAQRTDSSLDSDFMMASQKSSDDTKTDTTACSVAVIDCRGNMPNNKKRRIKIKVVTKQNQSTLTDRASVCNISTATDDWWSPIFEKKEVSITNKVKFEMDEVKLPRLRRKIERKNQVTLKSRGMETDGKFVTFRSRAQIIPRDSVTDILSPARYLLESQKYYNELFTSKYYAPCIFPVSHVTKYRKLHKSRSPLSPYHSRRSRSFKFIEWSPGKYDVCSILQTW